MLERPTAVADTVDVADVVRTLRRNWRAVIGFLGLGIFGAILVVLFAPRRFDGKSTLLAKAGSSSGTSIVSRITGIGDLAGGFGALTGTSALETELQILRSRALAEEVVDSLRLQIRVRDPRGVPPNEIVENLQLSGSFAPQKLRFERTEGGTYLANWGDSAVRFVPGQPTTLPNGTLTIRDSSRPKFTLVIMDREDAITRFGKRMEIGKSGGELAKVIYRADDSVTAAAGANALVSVYLRRRLTIDRGVNQRRVEYVTAQLDSTSAVLAATERALRRHQEESGVIDPEIVGKAEVEGLAQLRNRLTDLQVDEATTKQLLAQAQDGRITSRDLAAYPAFLRATAVGPLVGQLSQLEAQRIRLLEERTERDPEVIAIDKTARAVEANIVATARSYASSLTQQRTELADRIDRLQRTIMNIPAASERGGRLQRDVERMTAILTALQAQLIEARLAAIGEGGDVRQVDVAAPPRAPSFPNPIITMGIGTAGGLVAGIVAALFLGWFGRWLRDPSEIERAIGVAAQRIEPHAPLLLTSATNARTVLVVPLDIRADAGAVVARLARTAGQRAIQPAVLDLSAGIADNGNGSSPVDVGAMIDRLERENGMVIVRLPGLVSEATFAALRENRPVLFVAGPGPVDRVQLGSAVETLRRVGAPCAGVVISESPPALT